MRPRGRRARDRRRARHLSRRPEPAVTARSTAALPSIRPAGLRSFSAKLSVCPAALCQLSRWATVRTVRKWRASAEGCLHGCRRGCLLADVFGLRWGILAYPDTIGPNEKRPVNAARAGLRAIFGGGAKESRTPDLCSAIAALYQLSYGPDRTPNLRRSRRRVKARRREAV